MLPGVAGLSENRLERTKANLRVFVPPLKRHSTQCGALTRDQCTTHTHEKGTTRATIEHNTSTKQNADPAPGPASAKPNGDPCEGAAPMKIELCFIVLLSAGRGHFG